MHVFKHLKPPWGYPMLLYQVWANYTFYSIQLYKQKHALLYISIYMRYDKLTFFE
jgi:hypothetical protein